MFKHITRDVVLERDANNCHCSMFPPSTKPRFIRQNTQQDNSKRLRNFSLNLPQNKNKISISSIKKMRDSKNSNATFNQFESKQRYPTQNILSSVQTISSTSVIPKLTNIVEQPRLMFRTQRSPFCFQIQNSRLPQYSNSQNKSYFLSPQNHLSNGFNNNLPHGIISPPKIDQSQNRMLFSFTSTVPLQKNGSPIIIQTEPQHIKNNTQSSTQESQGYSYHQNDLPIDSVIMKKEQEKAQDLAQRDDSPKHFGFRRIESYQSGDKSDDDTASVVVKHYPISRLRSPFKPNYQKSTPNPKITRMSQLSCMFDNNSVQGQFKSQ